MIPICFKFRGFPVFLLIFACLPAFQVCAQTNSAERLKIRIPVAWKFRAEDKSESIRTDLDDKSWAQINAGQPWENQGINTFGYSWYRTAVVIPSSLKSVSEKDGILYLNLGRIGESDITYFNGKFLGETGSLPPTFNSGKNSNRVYPIKLADILWDQPNQIAIRVYSDKPGNSGLLSKDCFISPFLYTDYLSMNLINARTAHGFLSVLSYTNRSMQAVPGTSTLRVFDSQNKQVFEDSQRTALTPAGKREINFHVEIPLHDLLRVEFSFQDSDKAIVTKTTAYVSGTFAVKLPVKGVPSAKMNPTEPALFIPATFEEQKSSASDRIGFAAQHVPEPNQDGLSTYLGCLMDPHAQAADLAAQACYLESGSSEWSLDHQEGLKGHLDQIVYSLIHTQLADGSFYCLSENSNADEVNRLYGAELRALLAYYKVTGYSDALRCAEALETVLMKSYRKNPDLSFRGLIDPLADLYRFSGKKEDLLFAMRLSMIYVQESNPSFHYQLDLNDKEPASANLIALQLIDFNGLLKLANLGASKQLADLSSESAVSLAKNPLFLDKLTERSRHLKNKRASGAEVIFQNLSSAWIALNKDLFYTNGDLAFYANIENAQYGPALNWKTRIGVLPGLTFGALDHKPVFLSYEPGTYTRKISSSNGSVMNVSILSEGNFPAEGKVAFTVQPDHEESFSLLLRMPSYAGHFKVMIGGRSYSDGADASSGILNLQRFWKAGDRVEISFDMPESDLIHSPVAQVSKPVTQPTGK